MAEQSDAQVQQDTVYQPKLGSAGYELIPYSIYFFHIGPRQGRFNVVRHYFDRGGADPILPEMLLERLGALVTNAREPNQENRRPLPIGADFGYIVMERIAYVAFAFDFTMTKPPELRIRQQNGQNVSFFDAQLMNVEDCPVIVCVNHMKELNGGVQPFLFDLVTEPAVTWRTQTSVPDSGGTSTGPHPPPYPIV